LLGSGRSNAIVTHLPFADNMHDLDPGQHDERTPKILEFPHRFDDAFDGAVVLLDGVVQILALLDLFAGPPFLRASS
jgi:hypothetical protein